MKDYTLFIRALYLIVFVFLSYSIYSKSWQENNFGTKYRADGLSNEDFEKSQQAIEQWQKSTFELFRQLQELGVDYSEFNYQQYAQNKLLFGMVYSYDPDTGSKTGVPVAAVSPVGIMQDIGVENGDVIISINNISLKNNLEVNKKGQWLAAVKLTNILKNLNDGEQLEIKLVRNKKTILLIGAISGYHVPGFTLSLTGTLNVPSTCSYLRTIPRARAKASFYSAKIQKINGESVDERYDIKLPPGNYQIEVKENISNKRLSDSIHWRYRSKILELRVVPGMRYTIASFFNKNAVRDKHNYWKPIVLEQERQCFLSEK